MVYLHWHEKQIWVASKLKSIPHVDKITTVSIDVTKLSNVVDNDVAKKLYMINSLPRSVLPILRYKVLVC